MRCTLNPIFVSWDKTQKEHMATSVTLPLSVLCAPVAALVGRKLILILI